MLRFKLNVVRGYRVAKALGIISTCVCVRARECECVRQNDFQVCAYLLGPIFSSTSISTSFFLSTLNSSSCLLLKSSHFSNEIHLTAVIFLMFYSPIPMSLVFFLLLLFSDRIEQKLLASFRFAFFAWCFRFNG